MPPCYTFKIFIFVCASLFFDTSLAVVQKPSLLKVRGIPQYIHGINLPWLNDRYSSDLGYNPAHEEWGNGYSRTFIEKSFENIKNMNLNVTRFWLFEDLEGLAFDRQGFVSGIQPIFLKNLDHLVATANKYKLALYLTFFNNYKLNTFFGKPLPNGVIIKNFIDDPVARKRITDNVIAVIIKHYNKNPAIFAYDIINESNAGADNGFYRWESMREFSSQVAKKARSISPNILVSISTNWREAFDKPNHELAYGKLGLSFYDYHDYWRDPDLRRVNATAAEKPILLGEYGLPEPGGDEKAQNENAKKYLNQAQQHGWAGTLAWMYNNGTSSTDNNYRYVNLDGTWRPVAYTLYEFGANLADITASFSSGASVIRGNVLKITADYRCLKHRYSQAIIEIAVYDGQSNKVDQQLWKAQDFYPAEHKRYTWAWRVPTSLSPGKYTISAALLSKEQQLKTRAQPAKTILIK